MLISDFHENLENDYYQDNSVILMENIFFQANEVGYSYSEDQHLEKVRAEDRLPFV